MGARYSVDLDLGTRAVAVAIALAAPMGADVAVGLAASLSAPLLAEAKRRRRYERRKAAERGEIIRELNDGTRAPELYSPAELYALENAETVAQCGEMIAMWEAWERMYGPDGPAPDSDLYDLADEYNAA